MFLNPPRGMAKLTFLESSASSFSHSWGVLFINYSHSLLRAGISSSFDLALKMLIT